MAAGLGFKTFTTGEVLTAADVNGYLMQGVLVFATEAARNSAITSPQEGQFAFTKDTNSLWYYTGSAWAASGATGDIEGVTAGTGISGGGTSGTVTITNSMATAIDAKGDLVVGTGADTFSRLAVGTNGQVLTADSGEATGLKFATPAGGGAYTLINSGGTTLTGASVTISLSGTYTDLYVVVRDFLPTTTDRSLFMRFNSDSNTRYKNVNVDYGYTGVTFDQNYLRVTGRMSSSVADNLSVVYINDFQNTATFKICQNYGVSTTNAGAGNIGFSWNIGAYNQTSAITDLVFIEESGTNLAGGTVFVYGVK